MKLFLTTLLFFTAAPFMALANYNKHDGSIYSCNEIRVDIYAGSRAWSTPDEMKKAQQAIKDYQQFCRHQLKEVKR
ncbi:MAG: hypothetical protein ACXWT0_03960 [Methylobacter sp.]